MRPYTCFSMKPMKLSRSSGETLVCSSTMYSSMLKNQQFFRLTRPSFTRRTKIGYWPTGPTGTMNTVRLWAALLAWMVCTISRAIS